MDHVLVRCGIFVLSRSKRMDAETKLTAVGATPEQVGALYAYIRAGEPDESLARKYMAALLLDDARLRDALDGIGMYMKAREDSGPAHATNMPLGTPSCRCRSCEGWRKTHATETNEQDRCRMAIYLKRSDRWTDEQLMAEFAVDAEELARMLKAGAEMAGLPEWVETPEHGKQLKKSIASAEEAAKRAGEFRSADRQTRLRLLRGE